jgi:hypothetical protein
MTDKPLKTQDKYIGQHLDDLKGMTGVRSSGGISLLLEGETCLPVHTQVRPENASTDEHDEGNTEGEAGWGLGGGEKVGTCRNPDEVGWEAVEEEERRKHPEVRLCLFCGEFYFPHEAKFHEEGLCIK